MSSTRSLSQGLCRCVAEAEAGPARKGNQRRCSHGAPREQHDGSTERRAYRPRDGRVTASKLEDIDRDPGGASRRDHAGAAAPVPKTSSGKVRRSAARDLYDSGRPAAPPRALWRQMLRLWRAGGRPAAVAGSTGILYGGWWWTVAALCYVLGWLAVMALPRLRWRWATVRPLARAELSPPRSGRPQLTSNPCSNCETSP